MITQLSSTTDRLLGTAVWHTHSEVVDHVNNITNPHSTTKDQVGLGNVANVDQTNAGNITTGTLSDTRLSANVTLVGNTFNGANQLVKMTADSKLPAINGSLLTDLSGSAITSGEVSANVISNTVTKVGNTFNGANQLVKITADAKVPAIDGSLLTNLSKTQVGLSNVANVDQTNAGNITSGTLSDNRLSANVTLVGNIFNGANQLVKMTADSKLPTIDGSNLTTLNGSAIESGTISANRLDASVTKAGNIFNGSNQLVKLNADSKLPAINGSLLTNLTGANISNISGSTVTLATSSVRGTVPAYGISSGKFLRDDNSWQYIPSSVGNEYVIKLGAGTTIADKVAAAPTNGIPPGWTVVGGDSGSIYSQLSGTNNDIIFKHNLNKICVDALILIQSPLGGWHNGTPLLASEIKTDDITTTQTKIKNLNINIGSTNSIIVLRFI